MLEDCMGLSQKLMDLWCWTGTCSYYHYFFYYYEWCIDFKWQCNPDVFGREM